MTAVAVPGALEQVRGESSRILEGILPVNTVEGMPLRRFTLDEYHQLIDTGFFNEAERVELLEGILVYMSPNNPPHIRTVIRLGRTFSFLNSRTDVEVRAQGPVTIPDLMTEPEPDLVISMESGSDFEERHPYPSEVLLLMEVSDSSLTHDRSLKGAIYAKAGIAEYWIWNLVDGLLEVYRDPQTPTSGEAAYQTKLTYHSGESVSPLAFPELQLAVDDILPPSASTA